LGTFQGHQALAGSLNLVWLFSIADLQIGLDCVKIPARRRKSSYAIPRSRISFS